PFPTFHDLLSYGDSQQTVTGMAVAKIQLPDGKAYYFEYDVFGEPSAIVLPTGGRYEYTWDNVEPLAPTTALGNGSLAVSVTRRLTERRDLLNGSLTRKTTYTTANVTSGTENPLNGVTCGCTKV